MMWFIPKNSKSIVPLLTGLCLLLCFMAGCNEAPPPAKPAVVVKRIEQAPKKMSPEKKTTPSVKEAMSTPAVATIPEKNDTPQTEAVKTEPAAATTPDKKDAPQTKVVKADPSVTIEVAAGKETDQQADSEQLSLRSSLPDTSPLYNPAGKIDPFAALFSDNRGTTDSKDTKPKRPLTPLEKIDLSQLKLVAILQAQSGNKAMVEDATGKGYVLTPGTLVGINSGKVTNVSKDSVIVEEEIKDFMGKVNTNTRELKLQKPFGEE